MANNAPVVTVESMDLESLVSPAQLLELLPISRSGLYRMLRAGTIPSVRIGGRFLVDEGEVVAALESHRVAPEVRADGQQAPPHAVG